MSEFLFLLDIFKIAVNGRHLCEFVHRLPFHTSNYFLINGDVYVSSVKLEYDSPQASAPSFPSKCVCVFVAQSFDINCCCRDMKIIQHII